MGKANTGHSLPVGDRSWKYCSRCSANVRDLDNHSKSDGNGGIVSCR